MSTKKAVLIRTYLKYQQEIKEIINCTIFPDIEEIDIVDLLVLFNMYFNDLNTNPENSIKDLINLYKIEISKEDLEKVIPITLKFIKWLKHFQKIN
jgi:hypothetical protein